MALRLSTGLRNALLEKRAECEMVVVAQTTIAFEEDDGANGGDLISDSGSGLNGVMPRQMVTVYGSTSNNGTYEVLTIPGDGSGLEVAAGELTEEAASQSVTIAVADVGASFSDLFRNGVLRIFAGTQPADADTTEGTSPLVEISLASGTFSVGGTNGINWDIATSGVLGKDGDEVWSGIATATGTAGWFRFYDKNRTTGASTTAVRFDGAIATSGAQLNMSNLSITISGTTTIDSASMTLPTL